MRSILCIITVFVILACSSCSDDTSNIEHDLSTISKIDIHAHYSYSREYLPELFERWNMKAVIIDVARGVEEAERTRWHAMIKHSEEYPYYLFLCTSFDAYNIEEPDYAQKVINQLEDDIEAGAIMVKVWKAIGMIIKDEAGNYIQIDDARLQPIWDYLAQKKIPVLAHIADPIAGWLPYNENLAHARYFRNNPQYHPYLLTDSPRYEDIIAARDNWIANNPHLTIIGAHLGSLSHDVDLVAERLDTYDNFYVDLSARFGDLAMQSSNKVRDFMIKYQDRLVYGTDMGTNAPETELTDSSLENERASSEKILSEHWKYLTKADSLVFDSPMFSFPVKTKGLNLPLIVLEKIYYKNAAHLLKLSE
jgi:predicted TIM-barrel fold metal-dependent hydrolase